jgi:predicted alpha/beta-hydrolase family hydrolase
MLLVVCVYESQIFYYSEPFASWRLGVRFLRLGVRSRRLCVISPRLSVLSLAAACRSRVIGGKIKSMETPIFVFAHGAGAPSSHPWMQRWARRLATIGAVSTFDYPFIKERRKYPDPLPKLVAAHREALAQARRTHSGPAVLIGKSLGGRVGCHLALEEDVAGVICLGYPLCGGGNPTKLRDEVLRALLRPILFVQGTRDAFCPLDMLANVRREMTAANDLYVVEGGDHSLLVTKSQLKARAQTQDEVDERILDAIRRFVASNLRR